MSTETKKETRESWKTPIVMGSLAAVVLVFFGILGKPELEKLFSYLTSMFPRTPLESHQVFCCWRLQVLFFGR